MRMRARIVSRTRLTSTGSVPTVMTTRRPSVIDASGTRACGARGGGGAHAGSPAHATAAAHFAITHMAFRRQCSWGMTVDLQTLRLPEIRRLRIRSENGFAETRELNGIPRPSPRGTPFASLAANP